MTLAVYAKSFSEPVDAQQEKKNCVMAHPPCSKGSTVLTLFDLLPAPWDVVSAALTQICRLVDLNLVFTVYFGTRSTDCPTCVASGHRLCNRPRGRGETTEEIGVSVMRTGKECLHWDRYGSLWIPDRKLCHCGGLRFFRINWEISLSRWSLKIHSRHMKTVHMSGVDQHLPCFRADADHW